MVWKKAASVLLYAPLQDEINVLPLLATGLNAGKLMAFPRFQSDSASYIGCQIEHMGQLTPGQFGILEPRGEAPPVSLKQLDLVLVPGLAFDSGGRRLGRGKGFYDRLLMAVRGAKCGVAFDQQVLGEIPVESHDILMNFIVTPTRWLSFGHVRPENDLVG